MIAARCNINWWTVENIYATKDAFAALKKDGTTVCWGGDWSGGDCSEVQQQLVDVETIYATGGAFAAVKKDRTVVCWGSERDGGDCSAVQQQLVDVETIHATLEAFAAVERMAAVCGGAMQDSAAIAARFNSS